MTPIRYSIRPKHPAAHLFEVTVTVHDPDPDGQRFMLPAWIPGSYMIREFARNIVALRAESAGQPLACEKIDKATWRCATAPEPVTLVYEVYAWDLSVRSAHLDQTHGFFNGASVFVLPAGKEAAPCEVEIRPPDGDSYSDWRVATALPRAGAPAFGFGSYKAGSYDELIDHPVEMGTFSQASFEACGVRHHIVITGRNRADMGRLCADLKRICEHQIRLFEPETGGPPVEEYWFLVMAVGEGHGGLEHRASAALICARDELPLAHEKKISEGYRRFLGLAAHEYFHTWNVKRIKPEAFIRYDLAQENYTRQLWAFEGLTSYYDDLTLVRSGLIDELSYLELVADHIGRVMAASGRHKQSMAESSFDAWIKYYRQDENAPNAIVSYYLKGALVGLALDLTIRRDSEGRFSLDDVMRTLWNEYGRRGIGVPEGGVEAAAERVTGLDLKAFFAQAVHGTTDLDLAPLFSAFAVEMTLRAASVRNEGDAAESSLGARIGGGADAVLQQVFDGGAARQAGLSAGDIVIAVDGLRVNAVNLDKRIRSYPAGSRVSVTAFRRDELMTFEVALEEQTASTCVLTTQPGPADAKARRLQWLGLPPGHSPTE